MSVRGSKSGPSTTRLVLYRTCWAAHCPPCNIAKNNLFFSIFIACFLYFFNRTRKYLESGIELVIVVYMMG
jgi:hypothetical protein